LTSFEHVVNVTHCLRWFNVGFNAWVGHARKHALLKHGRFWGYVSNAFALHPCTMQHPTLWFSHPNVLLSLTCEVAIAMMTFSWMQLRLKLTTRKSRLQHIIQFFSSSQ